VVIITMRNCSSQAEYYTASIPDLAPPDYDAGMENWRDRFKARFEYLKRTEGLTQPKLAEKVGVSQPTISTWLSTDPTAQRTPENDEQFDRLADALGMHPAELRYGVSPMTEEARLREEAWKRLSPDNQKAVKEVIRALIDQTDRNGNISGNK